MQTFQDDIMRNKLLALKIEEKLTEKIKALEEKVEALEKKLNETNAKHEELQTVLTQQIKHKNNI